MTLLPLVGRGALVTGGARRLGGALSLALAQAGADVAVNYHQSEADAQAVVAEAQALGRRAVALRADVGQVEAARGLVATALDRLGRLDYLVHAASPFEAVPFAQVTEDGWDRALDTTLKGGFFVAQAAAPALAEARGAVVFISDIAARRPFPSFIPHSVAKAGLEALTVALAQALAPHVRVNAVAPGVVLPPAHWDAARVERAAAKTLVGHIGTPDDVAQAVLFLLTNPFITGQVVTVDGGLRIKD